MTNTKQLNEQFMVENTMRIPGIAEHFGSLDPVKSRIRPSSEKKQHPDARQAGWENDELVTNIAQMRMLSQNWDGCGCF